MKQGGYTFRFAGLRFVSSDKKVKFTPPMKQIFQDDDGSLTGTAGGWLTAHRTFHEWAGQCERGGVEVDRGVVCDDSVKVRRLVVDGYHPAILDDQMLAVTARLGEQDESWDVQEFQQRETYGWVTPLVTGKDYHLSIRRWDNKVPYRVDMDWVRLRYSDPAYVGHDANEWVTLSLNRTSYAHRFEVRMVFNEDHQTVSPDQS